MSFFNEINQTSRSVKKLIDAAKINVAAPGNQLPQLHVHVIGRLSSDEMWPGPVWGVGTAVSYESALSTSLLNQVRADLGLNR